MGDHRDPDHLLLTVLRGSFTGGDGQPSSFASLSHGFRDGSSSCTMFDNPWNPGIIYTSVDVMMLCRWKEKRIDLEVVSS